MMLPTVLEVRISTPGQFWEHGQAPELCASGGYSYHQIRICSWLHVPWPKSIYAYRDGCLLCPVLGNASYCLDHPLSFFHPLKNKFVIFIYLGF